MIFTSFSISLLLCISLILLSRRFNVYDIPDERKFHSLPTSKLGGIGIVTAYFLSAYLYSEINLSILLSCGILITLISIDDTIELNRYFRLLIQIIASFPIISSISSINGNLTITLLSILIICTFINLFNFFDGLNILLSSQFILILTFFLVNKEIFGFNLFEKDINILISSATGFLILNSIGLIFMGDIGSCFIGFITSFLFLSSIYNINMSEVILLISPIMPILTDTIFTLFVRFKNGEKFFSTPHKQHGYQLLALLGLSHWKVSLIYGIKFIIFTLTIHSIHSLGINYLYSLITLLFIFTIDIAFITYIRKVSFIKNLI
tara:strand:+ start:1696 stop:2661 length:966 start_codon:yes stop_codon:yes gene_type:complete